MAPAGCPAVQFSSDTVYQELAPAPTGYGLSIIRPPPTKVADGKWGVPGLPTTSVPLATDPRFPRLPPQVHSLARRLTGHRRAVCLLDCRCSVMSNPSATPWTEAPQAPVCAMSQARSLGWVAAPFSGDLPDPGTAPCLLHWQAGSLRSATREAPY